MIDISYDGAKSSVSKSLAESKLDYIDLMLLHMPYGGPERRKGAWRAVSVSPISCILDGGMFQVTDAFCVAG